MASIDGPRPLWQPAISLLYSVLYCLYFVLAINSVCVLVTILVLLLFIKCQFEFEFEKFEFCLSVCLSVYPMPFNLFIAACSLASA